MNPSSSNINLPFIRGHLWELGLCGGRLHPPPYTHHVKPQVSQLGHQMAVASPTDPWVTAAASQEDVLLLDVAVNDGRPMTVQVQQSGSDLHAV